MGLFKDISLHFGGIAHLVLFSILAESVSVDNKRKFKMNILFTALALVFVPYIFADGVEKSAKPAKVVYQTAHYPYNYRQYAPYAYGNTYRRYGLDSTYGTAYDGHDLGHSLHLSGGIFRPYGHEYEDAYGHVGAYKPHMYGHVGAYKPHVYDASTKFYDNLASTGYGRYPYNRYVKYY